jgi:hypothetical protein
MLLTPRNPLKINGATFHSKKTRLKYSKHTHSIKSTHFNARKKKTKLLTYVQQANRRDKECVCSNIMKVKGVSNYNRQHNNNFVLNTNKKDSQRNFKTIIIK